MKRYLAYVRHYLPKQHLYITKLKGILMSGVTHADLFASFRKGLRNGNWKYLNPLDRALFRASLLYAKHHGSIINVSRVKKLSALVEKLKETKGMRIFKMGFEKAVKLLEKSEEGVFRWASQLKYWLNDPDYLFWLGTMR